MSKLPLLLALLAPASASASQAYKDYAASCMKEVQAAGKDGVACLAPAQYEQVAAAAAAIGKVPGFEKSAVHIQKWLSSGWILRDTSLTADISAETRRDGSSRPWTSPQTMSENIALDGNVYLNTAKPSLFIDPADVKKAKKQAEALRKAGKEKALADVERRADVAGIQIFLQSVLVHEDVHTGQRFGDKKAKEGPAYQTQLDYLAALRKDAKDGSAQARRLDALKAVVEDDRNENAR